MKINTSQKLFNTIQIGKQSFVYHINPFIKYDIGLLVGLTYKYSEKIYFNTRLSNSIIPIGQEDYEDISSYSVSRKGKYNSVLSLSIKYNIWKKKKIK